MTDLPVAVDLRVDGSVDPIGLDEPRPRLTWRVELAPEATKHDWFQTERRLTLSWGRHVIRVAR
jgi:hypothetical protein